MLFPKKLHFLKKVLSSPENLLWQKDMADRTTVRLGSTTTGDRAVLQTRTHPNVVSELFQSIQHCQEL